MLKRANKKVVTNALVLVLIDVARANPHYHQIVPSSVTGLYIKQEWKKELNKNFGPQLLLATVGAPWVCFICPALGFPSMGS